MTHALANGLELLEQLSLSLRTALEICRSRRQFPRAWALVFAEQADTQNLTMFNLPFFEESKTAYQQFLEHPMTHDHV